MNTDEYGRVICEEDELFDLILNNSDISGLYMEENKNSLLYNATCSKSDKVDFKIPLSDNLGNVEQYHKSITENWLMPDEYKSIDVREYLYNKCSNTEQIERVIMEMDMYEERDLTNLLRLMIYLVDNFRANNIVWGVGRGSSVSSYVLYLIGITKIDPMKYDLDVTDFLR